MTLRFALPPSRQAGRPPEHRGLTRDGVRLLEARPGRIAHRRFRDLPGLLEPGDLVVLNTSATVPAALTGSVDARDRTVHVSGVLDDGSWVVEIRLPDGSGPDLGLLPGARVVLSGGVRVRLVAGHPDPSRHPSRLWRAEVTGATDLADHLARYGRPIRYDYVDDAYPMQAYQTVYASEPGSAEMASAGRPFTDRILVELISRGVVVTGLALHGGVSSPQLHEPPAPERFTVPAHTARLVTATRLAGGRVVAVGTTVVRALETAAAPWGEVRAASGWTDLVLDGTRRARVVDGLLTGLHEAEASHLLLLTAVAGADLVGSAYAAALGEDYLWHEFGDSMLFLP